MSAIWHRMRMSENIIELPTFLKTAQELAKECRTTYDAFKAEGFNDAQAFELLKWVLNE